MPYREFPILDGQVYHVFNRSIASQPIFNTLYDYKRILALIKYYRFANLPLRFWHYNRLSDERKTNYDNKYIKNNIPIIDILAYAIMPNHVHFLLKQQSSSAISHFMRNIQNGYAKYYNLKNSRSGSLFQFMFKAKRIETDQQLMHLSRYIHLNPVTAYIIGIDKLEGYPWTSFKYYLGEYNSFIQSKTVTEFFKSKELYKQFVYDQVDYQRKLADLKHFFFE